MIQEHLEPQPGAILMFQDDGGWEPGVVGYRWLLRKFTVREKPGDVIYLLTRVDMPDVWFQCTQADMDRCGRMLVSGPGEEQVG